MEWNWFIWKRPIKTKCLTTSGLIKSRSILLRAQSRCLLNIDRHGTSIASLGSLFLHLTIFIVNIFFPMFILTFSSIASYNSCSVISSKEQRLSSSPPQEDAESNEVTSQPPFLQTGQHLLSGHVFVPFYNFCCLLWMLSNTLSSFLYGGT